jgi:excisionase family DNA binding protein
VTPRPESELECIAGLLERLVAGVEGLRAVVEESLAHGASTSNCRDAVEPNAAHDPLQLLTADEVAALLRVDVRTLRTMRHERAFPRPTRVGRSLRWKRSAVERWIDGGAR